MDVNVLDNVNKKSILNAITIQTSRKIFLDAATKMSQLFLGHFCRLNYHEIGDSASSAGAVTHGSAEAAEGIIRVGYNML